MSENRETDEASPLTIAGMTLDPAASYRAISARDPRFDGRLFVGVKTTGIYCRPICPARTPKPQNVLFYPTAAAAQDAGFRPCLRCRPEAAPDMGAWRGTSNTVTRALRLIEEGALDSGDVDALAERLGVGERHLRRLFKSHLGAAPVSVAQTRRILLAKQLIHETQLPMTEVALAAGFGSVRRFNETFAQLYGRPPGSLRRAEGAAPAVDEGVCVRLPFQAPYDWPAMLAFFAGRAVEGLERVEGGRYIRALALGDEAGAIVVEPDQGDALKLTVHLPRITWLPTVIARVRRMFDLAADPAAIAAHLGSDPLIGPLIEARPGIRIPGYWDPFETAVRAVLGQQVTVRAAVQLAGRLTQTLGEPLKTPILGLTHLFPTAQAIASADLSRFGMPASRGRTLNALAQAVLAEPSFLAPGAEHDASLARLRALPGVGDWTVQYVAMRGLREPDALPASDVALIRTVEALSGARPTAPELAVLSEAWRPWRAYGAQHLWTADTATVP